MNVKLHCVEGEVIREFSCLHAILHYQIIFTPFRQNHHVHH